MTVEWFRCQNSLYTPLKILDLSNEEFDNLFGVYIIWCELKIIFVGSGYIRRCLSDHKKDSEILANSSLQVSWAEVPIEELENVESFLIDRLHPAIIKNHPNKNHVSVNLPWEKTSCF